MSVKTKQKILELLKWKGPTSQENLATALELSTMAVSKHLGEFQKQGLVSFEEQKQDRGRPIKIWRLTESSKNHFPDNHPQLAYSIWQSATEVLEQEAIEKILSKHSEKKIEEYRELIPQHASMSEKIKILSDIRSKEGYMTSHEVLDDLNFKLNEHHCPICDIASKCKEFCGSEIDIFKQVLGPEVSIEREEHIVSGDHRCTYKITKNL
jgi:predicted ArsR family transcriptional regulator